MASDTTEEEQVEAIKNWFEQNGTSLIVGIVVSLAAVFGYQSWQKTELAETEKASSLYMGLTEAIVAGPLDTLSSQQISTGKFIAAELKADFPASTYAHFAALHLAKLAVEEGDLDAAASELDWIGENNPERPVGLIVNLRLAKIKAAQEDYDAALGLLNVEDVGAHASSYQEQRGDIYLAMGKPDQAHEAYKLAMEGIVEGQNKPVLQMKLEDLIDPQNATVMNKGAANESMASDAIEANMSESDAQTKDGAG
ncbi:tetratricopeptide repeat protein [Pseudomonadales bacterium]|nr:tetratricopeptide repeat protein [Pseudomonadales bacterium]MDC0893983.1 tetratricopeptide repeat protein [Pseudomonadales bacterium]MDC1084410.1 tetratricopeptide repeat protein [Pseudomonadales bacterium]MDC6449984.1 tetratricopeptide repeat protein [Pseudomonadales bacterium]